MRRYAKKRSDRGLPPGTLVHVGEKKAERVRITIVDYDESHFLEKEAKTVEECFPFKDTPTVTWINIEGLHQVEIIEKIGDHFEIHPLLQEDILNTEQRPKAEDFENYIFIILKMIAYDEKKNEITSEQVSIVLGKNFVISFQERGGNVFDSVRERIKYGKGRIKKMGTDYLAYSLMDAIVDNYFAALETLGEKIEFLEEGLISSPTPRKLQSLHELKREMLSFRKLIWPLREAVSVLEREESPIIQETTRIYLRDIYENIIQAIDTVEILRDMLSGMLDIYLSSISNRMNEIMKVLTIISTIFIPLTFIAGVYGMNFKFMPELEMQWGYFMILSLMAAIGFLMVFYFRRKGWL